MHGSGSIVIEVPSASVWLSGSMTSKCAGRIQNAINFVQELGGGAGESLAVLVLEGAANMNGCIGDALYECTKEQWVDE